MKKGIFWKGEGGVFLQNGGGGGKGGGRGGGWIYGICGDFLRKGEMCLCVCVCIPQFLFFCLFK